MADEAAPSEVLSQSEVESILSSISAGGFDEQVQVLGQGKDRKLSANSIVSYDFRSPVYLTPAQMRRLRIKHEDFIRSLSAALSLYLRMDFLIQMSRLETIPYAQLLEALPVPSHLTLFKMKPLDGICLFEIAPRLGLTVLDRMMGGPGHSVKTEREFTDIELSVLKKFISMILKEYTDSWLKFQALEFEIIEHESTARFLNIVQPDDVMLFLEMEARFGDCVAGLRLVLPYLMIESLVAALMKEVSSEQGTKDSAGLSAQSIPAVSLNVPVPVSAHWRGSTMTLGDLKNLEVGDVILLDPKSCGSVIIDLGALPKFNGKIDRNKSPVAVTIGNKRE